MLKYARIALLVVCSIIGFMFAFMIIVWRPFNPKNTYIVTRYFLAPVVRLIKIKVNINYPDFLKNYAGKGVVYAANHQSNWDIVTLADCVLPGTVAIGKKSLVWVPLFGVVYFLSGCVRLDRENKTKAMATMNKVSEDLTANRYSIWIFPEGTRSKGKGLGKFKTGPVLTASQAGVPLIPIVASSYINNFDMNRWNNGHLIMEYLEPIVYPSFDLKNREDVRELKKRTNDLREKFVAKIAELDEKVRVMNEKEGVTPVIIPEAAATEEKQDSSAGQ